MRTILSVSFAIAAAAATFGVSAGPALAATPAEVCAQAPAALKSLAQSADRDAQRLALRNVQLGEALCDARNRPEAAKKFRAAAEILGTDLQSAMAKATETASIQ